MAITTGSTVRITRRDPQGTVKFVKSGRVGIVSAGYFEFTEDMNSRFPGQRAFVSTDEALPSQMKGWTQETVIVGG
ncbi:hypothetical protein ACWC0A_37880 [Streptomyces scopuliridis]